MSESVRRFDLALQRSHILVFSAGTLAGLIASWLNVFRLSVAWSVAGWVTSCICALIFHELFRRGVSRRILNPLWLAVDVLIVDPGISASGGIRGAWFIWYLPAAAAAAFASGKRAAHLVSIASAVSYLAVLMLMGEA